VVRDLKVWENVVLGCEPLTRGCLSRSRAREQTRVIAQSLGVDLPLDATLRDLPVGLCQIVEIAKALHRRARILVLDEPTSALSPPEADRLFSLMAELRDRGVTVILVTHRVQEVVEHATRATVLRRGRAVRTFQPGEFGTGDLVQGIVGDPEGDEALGVGSEVTRARPRPADPCARPLLVVRGVHTAPSGGVSGLKGVHIAVQSGEILGIAGVAGNGQQALVDTVVGRARPASGSIVLAGTDVTERSVAARRRAGLAFIPEDRGEEGLVPGFSVGENLVLGSHRRFARAWGLSLPAMRAYAREAIQEYGVRTVGHRSPIRMLSGGNQQKVLVARELLGRPGLVVAAYPTRGLDLEATEFVRSQLARVRDSGGAVLLLSADLDELAALADRIAVMYRGEIAGCLPSGEFSSGTLGEWMTAGNRGRSPA